MTAERHQGRAELAVPGAGNLFVVPATIIYGANGSGKSNVIDAVRWMHYAVTNSYRRWNPTGGVPRRRFEFRNDAAEVASEFEVDFTIDGIRYSYGFSVDDEQILGEWLYYFPEGRSRRLFERDNEGVVTFGRWLAGRRKIIAESLRPNSLFLSVAAAQAHEQLTPIFRWFQFGLRGADDSDFPQRLDYTLHLCEGSNGHESDARAINAMLAYADLGLSTIKANAVDEHQASEFKKVRQAIRDAVGNQVSLTASKFTDVRVVHATDSGEFELPLRYESSGTRTWVGLAGLAVSALRRGSVLFVDELDARMHPHLVDMFVGMFTSPDVNRYGAQLICSSHDVSLVGRHARTEVSRDQIWLTEKDPRTLATRLFPLTDIRTRATDNFEHAYLLGRYGAVPFLEDDYHALCVALFEDGGPRVGEVSASQAENVEYSATAAVPDLY